MQSAKRINIGVSTSMEPSELYHDEIDERLIPTEYIKMLPDPIRNPSL